MSIFRVKLQNTAQGKMDVTSNVGHDHQNLTSIQRTAYIMGPNKVNRKLVDGQTFQDCNYYKRFCPVSEGGLATDENAILTIVTDDNSVYSDIASENTTPFAVSRVIAAFSTYTDANNQFNFLTLAGGPAVFLQLTNAGLTTLQVRLNGLTTAVFTLEANSFQVFNLGDLQISLVEIDNNGSGHVDATLEVLAAVRSVCNS